MFSVAPYCYINLLPYLFLQHKTSQIPDNVVVTDVTKQDEEEGECSDADIPPPPPPKINHTPSQATKNQVF